MAIKNLIARGVGFSPGSIKFIVTHGFSISSAVQITTTDPRDAIFQVNDVRTGTFQVKEIRDAIFQVNDTRDGEF